MTDEVQGTVEPQSTDVANDDADLQAEHSQEDDQERHKTDEASEAEKAVRASQRRIDRLTREKYQMKAEIEQLRQSTQRGYQEEQRQLTEQDVETLAEQKAREIAELNQFNSKCNEVYENGLKATKEFKTAFTSLVDEIGTPFDEKGKPTTVMAAILDADEPHKLILHLAENPDLAAELADLSASRQIRRIAQIERDMATAPQKSSAPAPTKPINGAASAKKDISDPNLSYDDFVKLRREQIKNRR